MSPSTAEYDRTDKLAEYQRIPGLWHIAHVSHEEPRIDVWTRDAAGWQQATFRRGEVASLPAIACRLDVDETYTDPLASRA